MSRVHDTKGSYPVCGAFSFRLPIFLWARHAARLTGGVGNYARVRSGDKHGFLPRNPALGGAVICTKRMMVYALPRRVKEEEEEEEEEEVLFLSEF